MTDEKETINPANLMIHLNHPCDGLDIWHLENPATETAIAKGQGYVSLAELREVMSKKTSNSEAEIMIERVFEIGIFEQTIKGVLIHFVNKMHAQLIADKIISELLKTNMVDDCYVKAFAILKGEPTK